MANDSSEHVVRGSVIGVPVNVVSWDAAEDRIRKWAAAQESRYVCLCNVHSVVTAARDDSFLTVISGADMAAPDGAPVAWMLRRTGFREQARIDGPGLMWRLLSAAERDNRGVFFYGSTETTLAQLAVAAKRAFPRLNIAGLCSPRFSALSAAEHGAHVDLINRSGASLVFVALGCPKQERWMADQRGRVNAVMIGVGAAFDYHAGSLPRAPRWMQAAGLEWFHRLLSEPRRLWYRYLTTNTYFIWKCAGQLFKAHE